jgi:hypothetical protein
MGDPRLNSLHLDPIRRQDFRRARDELLRARGNETLYAERQQAADHSGTVICQPDAARVPAGVHFWLVDRDYIYPLKVGLNTLGRSSDNDIVVEELYISRRHCAILVHHTGQCVLHDMSSRNGTYLNNVRISGPTPLHAGDEIRICNRQFIFLNRDVPPPGGEVTQTIGE